MGMSRSGSDRRMQIRDIVLREGEVDSVALAASLRVSLETVRRDLKRLEEGGFLTRTHGGAKAATGYSLPHIDLRMGHNREGKRHIARLARSLVEPSMSVFFSGGSTVLETAWQLRSEPHISATSTMVDIAMVLATGGQSQVCLCGGWLDPSTRACDGFEAFDMIARRSFDIAFMGASGLHPGRGMLGQSETHLQLARTVKDHAQKFVVLFPWPENPVDGRFQVLPLTAIDVLITDRPPQREFYAALERAGVHLMY